MLGAEKRGQRGEKTGTRSDEKKMSRGTKGRGAVNELHYYTRKKCDERRRYGSGGWIHNADTGTSPPRRAAGAPGSKVTVNGIGTNWGSEHQNQTRANVKQSYRKRKSKKRHIQKGSPPQSVQRYPGAWRGGHVARNTPAVIQAALLRLRRVLVMILGIRYSILEGKIPRPSSMSMSRLRNVNDNAVTRQKGKQGRRTDTTSRTRSSSPRHASRHTHAEPAREQCTPQSVNRH
ncbi:hypothetical protein LXA43DRAFT_50773 [Ganoderma leucocontextum]|nr:hypothetical protein LXA43DRAFT_50773 [Ganoderma leucocontextum]